jgi:hypothetical protein
MANKFQSAMPGALPGADLLHHFYLLYRFAPGPYGLRAQMGAKATITLPVTGAVAIIGSVGRPNWSYAPSMATHSTSLSTRNGERERTRRPPFREPLIPSAKMAAAPGVAPFFTLAPV